jgi:CelD/BcsL family acetyltransferase involved in cellulose biosynthesis
VNISVLQETSELVGLRTEWNALLVRSRANSVFLTWEWFQAWLSIFTTPPRLFVLAVRNVARELVGIAPFYITEMVFLGALRYQVLRIAGDYPTGSEYPDWIVRRDCEREACLAIAEELSKQSHAWDCIWLPHVPGWTGARERIESACAAVDFAFHARTCEFSSFRLPASYDEYVHSLSQSARSSLRRRRRQIIESSGYLCELCKSEEDLHAHLKALFQLNHRRWSHVGQEGTFVRKPLEATFYEMFTRVALNSGWLRFFGLRIGEELKAVQIGYSYENVFYQLQEGFDPTSMQGIGNVLRSEAIRHLIAEGVREYDFLGEFTDHKRRWLAQRRIGYDFFIGRKNSVKAWILFLQEVWPTGRYLQFIGH